jgi:hypothetical protein
MRKRRWAKIKSKTPTLSRTFDLVRWSLKTCLISAHVAVQPEIFTPVVA